MQQQRISNIRKFEYHLKERKNPVSVFPYLVWRCYQSKNDL